MFKCPMNRTKAPACQIHHNHHDHWVASIFHNNKIYLMDSLGNERPDKKLIPTGLEIQLSQLYGEHLSDMTIHVPSVMKQNNSIDCGLYAIAFITFYCLRKQLPFDLIFDCKQMRAHLIACFESERISEFPLTKKTLSIRRKKNTKTINIRNYCICHLPECFDDLVECDKCKNWYHKSCVNAPSDDISDFHCQLC